MFGDGWNSIYFYNYDFYGTSIKKTVTCDSNIIFYEYCFDPILARNGDHIGTTVIQIPNQKDTQNENSFLSEISWKAIIINNKSLFVLGFIK